MATSIEQLKVSLGDRYMPERELGRGGMATVYLAEDRKHRRKVALKVLEAPPGDGSAGSRFLREIEIAANLSHPRILPVFDSGQLEDLLYYVMPYVEGESLRERLDWERRLPLPDAVRIAREVANALSYAHAHGVIHRDIKPGNILLTEGGAVVTDFGIARATTMAGMSLTRTGLLVGTPAYMSPEQVAAETEPDHRADIYALGCVLYEMVVGEPPFPARTAQAVLASHLARTPPRARETLPEVPSLLDEIIGRALAKDPEERFESADELVEALDHIARAQSVDSGPSPRTRRKRRRDWLIGVGISLAVAIALAFAVFLADPSGRAEPETAAVTEGADAIAVLPFDASGLGIEDFGEGIVSLLSANLDGVGGIQTVSPRSVFNAWGAAGRVDFQKALELGRELDAGSVLMGSLVAAGDGVRMTAELHEVRAGGRLARAQVRGSADSLLALVDTLSIHLLREVWRSREPIPDLRLSAIFSGSIAAIRHYLRGEHHFRRTAWDSASYHFERAVEEDTSFALAHWRLSESRAWTTVLGSAAEMIPLKAAYRHRDRLPTQERVLVVARVLDSEGDIAALDSMRAYVARDPYDAEGWFVLADLMVHAMPLVPRPWGEILKAFDRALELQPSMRRALIHPLHLTALAGDSAGYHRYLARLDSLDAEAQRFAAWGDILWSGGSRGSDTLLAAVLTRAPVTMNSPFLDALVRNQAMPANAIAGAFTIAADRMPETSPEFSALQTQRATSLWALGRVSETDEPLKRLWEIDPDHAARLAVEGSIALGVASPLLERAQSHLREAAAGDPMASLWLAWLTLDRGEREQARSLAEAARTRARADSPAYTLPLVRATAGWIDVAQGDSARGIQIMEEALRRAGYAAPGRPLWYQVERFLARIPARRDDAIERLRYARSQAPYTAGRFALLATAFQANGRLADAAEIQARLNRLLATADERVRGRFGLSSGAAVRVDAPTARAALRLTGGFGWQTEFGPTNEEIAGPDEVHIDAFEIPRQ